MKKLVTLNLIKLVHNEFGSCCLKDGYSYDNRTVQGKEVPMARTKETLHQAPLLHNNHLDTKQFPSHIKRRGQVQRGRD